MATASMIVDLDTPGEDLARKTVFVKLHLGLLGNTRKVSSAQVEVDADKNSIHISKSLLDSPELEAVRRLDGEIRRYLYSICLPFEPGIHLLPIGLIEPADDKLNEFRAKLKEQVERARHLLSGTTTDAIRNTTELRARVREGMSEIAQLLETMVSDRVG